MTRFHEPIRVIVVAAILAAGLVLPSSAQGPMGGGMGQGMGMGRGMGMGGGMVRHHFFMMNGIPEEYRASRNPLPADVATVAAGIEIYQENCALCHGVAGRGDGEGAKDLDPPPQDLMATMNMPISSDSFLFWTVSEGGEALGTDMPAFRDVLTEGQIWQVIHALRAHLQPVK